MPEENTLPRGWLARLRAAIARYRDARLISIGYGLYAPGGGWKSIVEYHRHLEMAGENAILIGRPGRHSARKMLMSFFVARRVLFNGLDCFFHFGPILFCLLRPDTLVYLHETEFIFAEFRRAYPGRFRWVQRIIQRNRICCVSRQQEEFLRNELGARRTHVVYENIVLATPDHMDDAGVKILMVGTVSPRKGATLFSQVADLAAERGLPWRFHWVGPVGGTADLYLSPHVNWLGAKPDVTPFLSRADVFFLSSLDDPFPLACLEALALFRKSVVFRKTGLAEVLADIRGCAVYETHEPEAALTAIERALATPLDVERVRRVNESISSVGAFAQRMDVVLRASDRAAGREPVRGSTRQGTGPAPA